MLGVLCDPLSQSPLKLDVLPDVDLKAQDYNKSLLSYSKFPLNFNSKRVYLHVGMQKINVTFG